MNKTELSEKWIDEILDYCREIGIGKTDLVEVLNNPEVFLIIQKRNALELEKELIKSQMVCDSKMTDDCTIDKNSEGKI